MAWKPEIPETRTRILEISFRCQTPQALRVVNAAEAVQTTTQSHEGSPMSTTNTQSNIRRFFARTALALGLATISVQAQSLDAQVVQNPNDTVTYTIDLQGPPQGQGFVLLGALVNPLPIPTPFGPLYLDPLGTFVLGAVRLDQFGQGSVTTTVPAQATAGISIYFQGLFMDNGILRLTNDYVSTVQDIEHNDFGRRPSFAFAHGNGQAHFQAWGQPGQTYIITILGPKGVVARCSVTIGQNSTSPIRAFGLRDRLRRGYRYVVSEDIGGGQVLPLWRGEFKGL